MRSARVRGGVAMPSFVRLFDNDRLFAAPAGTGQLYLVLPSASSQTSIEFEEAWTSTDLLANFVYCAGDMLVTPASVNQFIDAVMQRVMSSGAARGFLYMLDALAWRKPPLGPDNAPMLGINGAGTQVQTGMTAPILPGAALRIQNLATLTFDGTIVTLSDAVISFSGSRAPSSPAPASRATLSLVGESRGTIFFEIYLNRSSLRDASSWGFQFLFPAPPESVQPAIYEWLPLATDEPPNAIGFAVTIDPSDPENQVLDGTARRIRSKLAFTGTDDDGQQTVLSSQFRTTFGLVVTLIPDGAALVFNHGVKKSETDQELQLAPMGDFVLQTPGGAPSADLLCGLHGTELLAFQSKSATYEGDRMRFAPYQPAYAPKYPFPEVSSVGPPVDLQAPLLDDTYTTSWATVVRAKSGGGGIPYVAQPLGSSLYGWDPLIWQQQKQLMGWVDPVVLLPDGVTFPLAPYSGVQASGSLQFTPAQTADFERQVLGPTRRRIIGSSGGTSNSRRQALGLVSTDTGTYNTTTPAGLLATIEDGKWKRILLGQNLNPLRKLYFCNPSPLLQQAFQTGQLFLVVANATELGTFVADGNGSCGNDAQFFNSIEIGGWKLAANVGKKNAYDDYRNVLIVKGRPGKLYDPIDPTKSLVANPDKWTQRETFASPSDLVSNPTPPPSALLNPPDPSELVILSQWLQDFFEAASKQAGSENYAKFNAIAQDEGWSGILVLRMDITGVPTDLAGIIAGIREPTRFNAHHFGIEISQVRNGTGGGSIPGPTIDDTSSMFGLIDYVDSEFVVPIGGEAPQPVPPIPGTAYDFILLQLQVLIENTAVRRFGSYAQLTATSWFDMQVEHMGEGGSPYAAIVLRGSMQNNNGQPVYSLSSASDTTFYFSNDAINKIEITNVTMSTRSATSPITSWFSLTGFIDYRIVQGTATAGGTPFVFDIFSFGSTAGNEDQLRRGLSFSNLGIQMSFLPEAPAVREFIFSADEIRFDIGTSTPRTGSLFQQFALELSGLVRGTKDIQPSSSGYANVVTDARLTGVAGGSWWGLSYKLNMGTPGNLAGKVGLVSRLLTAWAPDPLSAASGYKAMVGLQLPGSSGGANLISLQTVLKLSVGQIWLKYDVEKSAFLLLLTEIALKLFGLLSIPPGSTLFYLYGNPNSGGKPSGLGWYAMYRQKRPA